MNIKNTIVRNAIYWDGQIATVETCNAVLEKNRRVPFFSKGMKASLP